MTPHNPHDYTYQPQVGLCSYVTTMVKLIGAMPIPIIANVEAIHRSTMEDVISHLLGKELQICRRSRLV